MIRLLLCAGLLSSCGKATDDVPPEAEHAPWPERAAAYEADLQAHREGGWLVVRTANGLRDEGDSLTWTGEAMGVSCAQAEATLSAFEHMQDSYGGYYVRIDPLPAEYAQNPVSRDGWVGVMYGIARSWRRCPDLQARMTASFERARAAVGTAARLHPSANVVASVTPWFRYVTDAVSALTAGAPRPTDAARVGFELAGETTAASIVSARSACYPLHLMLSEILTLSAVGLPISAEAKRNLCNQTASTGLMNWRWYCQDSSADVASWLEQYQPNKIVYRHQRCDWESEDFPITDSVASLDWLTLRDLYIHGE